MHGLLGTTELLHQGYRFLLCHDVADVRRLKSQMDYTKGLFSALNPTYSRYVCCQTGVPHSEPG